MVLSAPTGAGKSSCQVAWFARMIEKIIPEQRARIERNEGVLLPRELPLWTTGFRLVSAHRAHPLGQGQAPLIARATRARVLLLDEVGQESTAEGVVNQLLDERYQDEDLVTLVATGLPPREFAKRYGAAAWRRARERSRVIDAFAAAETATAGMRVA
jgi:hypothetical protein